MAGWSTATASAARRRRTGARLSSSSCWAAKGRSSCAKYLQLMHAQGFTAPIAFEASVQCQARPGYDALASAVQIYRWMADGWQAAGIPTD